MEEYHLGEFGEGDAGVTIVEPLKNSNCQESEAQNMAAKQKIMIVDDDSNIAELDRPLSQQRMF